MTQVLEWRSLNNRRNYPFKEGATRVAVSGSSPTTLPTDFIIDLIVVTPRREDKRYFLRSISITSTTTNLFFAEENASVIASVSFSTSNPPVSQRIPLVGLAPFTTGAVVLGRGSLFLQNLIGKTYTLTLQAGELEPRAIRNNPFGAVTSVANLSQPTLLLTGDVKLREGYNVDLVRTGSVIRVDIGKGLGLGVLCGECTENSQCIGAVKSLNGITPDENGNVILEGKNFVTVTKGNYKITLGTSIKDEDLSCTRSGTPGGAGPDGPKGPAGPKGQDATDCCDCPPPCICNDCTEECPPTEELPPFIPDGPGFGQPGGFPVIELYITSVPGPLALPVGVDPMKNIPDP